MGKEKEKDFWQNYGKTRFENEKAHLKRWANLLILFGGP
jgi:hypothetical protein